MSLILKTLPNEKRLGKLIGHKPINRILCENVQFNKSILSEATRQRLIIIMADNNTEAPLSKNTSGGLLLYYYQPLLPFFL